MSKNAHSSMFTLSAAKTVFALTLLMTGSRDALAQEPQGVTMEDTPDLETAKNLKSVAIVTWGDSIGNGVGLSLRGKFNSVTNIGHDGAGLLIATKPEPLENIPKGAAVLMSIGTNDVETLIGKDQKNIDNYAARVISVADEVRKKGGIPILIGMQAPLAPYTGNKRWSEPGFLAKWTLTMVKVNDAIESAAKKSGTAYSRVQGRVPERKTDNLHYTDKGGRHIAANALKDAGIRY